MNQMATIAGLGDALLSTAAVASLLAAFGIADRRRNAVPGRHRAGGAVRWRDLFRNRLADNPAVSGSIGVIARRRATAP